MAYDTERRIFHYLNRYFMVPVFRLGFGSLYRQPVLRLHHGHQNHRPQNGQGTLHADGLRDPERQHLLCGWFWSSGDREMPSAPVIRIRPAGVRSGPADPGGWLWVLWVGISVLPFLVRWWSKKRKA